MKLAPDAPYNPMETPARRMLATLALVGSLVLSAHADLLPARPTANQIYAAPDRGKFHWPPAKTSFHRLLFPDATYLLDDGHADTALGFTSGGDIICLNEFTVADGGYYIDSVSIAWGSPNLPDPTLNGLTFTAVLWSAPYGGGDPTDAIVVATAPGTISQAGTDGFVTISAPCFHTSIPTADFFAGFIIHSDAGQEPAALDETPPILSNRSYVAAGVQGNIFQLGLNDLPVAPIESYGFAGNWLIRADGNVPPPRGYPGPPRWYNGDLDGINGLPNEQDSSLGAGQYARVYEDFDVPDPAGWDVTGVISYNLTDLPTTCVMGATWEIRQGITPGYGGTLFASGMTMTPYVIMTGRSAFGYNEYQIQVYQFLLHLPHGHYFLNVTPIGDEFGRSFASTTSGANAVGSPPGNDQNAYIDSNYFGESFVPTGRSEFQQPYDYSMGVFGTVSLALVNSTSRLVQGAAGPFEVRLPGIEDRAPSSSHTIVFTFSDSVTFLGTSTISCGTVQSVTVDPNDPKSLLVKINTPACDQQAVTVTLTLIAGSGTILDSVSTTVSFLYGDVNGDGKVNNRDLKEIHAAFGQNVDSSNFRADLNADGAIDRKDIVLYQTFRGNSLP